MKDYFRKIILFGISLLFFSGCILTPPEKTSKDIAPTVKADVCPPDRMQPFQVPLVLSAVRPKDDPGLTSQVSAGVNQANSNTTLPIKATKENEEDRKIYTIRKLTYPSFLDQKKEAVIYFYSPKEQKMSPAIVILPITKGDYYTEHLADYLVEHGFFILRFQSRGDLVKISKTGMEAMEEFRDHIRSYVMDILEGIDWLQSQPGIDTQHIGVLGISQGAIMGSVVTGLDSRIKSGAFLLGGGGLAGILLTSNEGSIIQIRENILKSSEITKDSFYQEANKVLSVVDPLTYAGCIHPSRVLLVNAIFDHVIRPTYADQLWEKMGRPARIQIPTGHYTSGLFLPYVRIKILEHFQETLGNPEGK